MNHNPYRKTTMPDLLEKLQKRFGSGRGAAYFHNACEKLRSELTMVDKRRNQAIIRHLTMGILPCAACYRALLDGDLDRESTYDFVRSMVLDNTRKTGAQMKRLCFWMPFSLFRHTVRLMIANGYPAAGWAIEWQREAPETISFCMKSCFYLEAFERLGCRELCAIYCEADFVMFEPLAPKIHFSRKGTLENGCRCCDFHFIRAGRDQ